ncbi:MAG: glycosyltransferase family 4 protein [Phaeodactylibacter sp.]|nr:glycosyltransferase family 4 protein [Phaeodactylibacter sp.]MCB9051409.1 glycosyltransferase family 4 protein [Lewinellaceae bacterium]
MLRIGYDAKRLFNNFTGLGNYSRTLLANLSEYYPDNAYFLYSPKITRNDETHFFLNSALFNVHLPRRGSSSYWRTIGIRRDLARHKVQLFHGLSHEIPLGLDKAKIRSIVTIHDLVFERFPEHYPFIDRKIYSLKFRYACRHADHIVAISESTKRDIIELYGISPEKITVIYQSCHERYMVEKSRKTFEGLRRRYHLPEEYLLTVGSITARKNLMGVIRALELLPESSRLPLVVVGRGGRYRAKVQAFIQKNRLENLVHFIDVSFDDLPAVYQKASAFLYPSFYEGFGIPILEALFSKTPVITSNLSSLPEAVGPGAHLVDPHRPEEIAAGIVKILSDEAYRQGLISAGYAHAQQFRGEPLAGKMMDLYVQVAGGGNAEPEPIT